LMPRPPHRCALRSWPRSCSSGFREGRLVRRSTSGELRAMSSEGVMIDRRRLGLLGLGLATAAATGVAAAAPGFVRQAKAAPAPAGGEPIKVGILHSLSGTMAISEAPLKDVMMMLIAEQNKKGGVMGRPLEAVVVDPASNWPLFAEKAKQLLSVDKVAAVFGCWTSVSRKSVLPVFEQLNGI